MKVLFSIAATAVLVLSGCSNLLGPSDSQPRPAEGAIFSFHTTGVIADTVVSRDFSDTIHLTEGGFNVAHSYDSTDRYLIIAANDLRLILPFDSLTLGVYSHGTFSTRELSMPVRYRDSAYTGYIGSNSRYAGDGKVSTSGNEYACHKVELTTYVRFVDDHGVSRTVGRGITTFWYCPTIHYFARQDYVQFYNDSVVANTVSTLTAIQ